MKWGLKNNVVKLSICVFSVILFFFCGKEIKVQAATVNYNAKDVEVGMVLNGGDTLYIESTFLNTLNSQGDFNHTGGVVMYHNSFNMSVEDNGAPMYSDIFLPMQTVTIRSGQWKIACLATINNYFEGTNEACGIIVVPYEPVTNECNHAFEWVTTQEPSEGIDGEKVLRCSKCGQVSDRVVISALSVQQRVLEDNITEAPASGNVDYDCKRWTCFYDYTLKKMSERSDITYKLTFTHKNKRYQLIIPAGTDYSAILSDDSVCDGLFGVAKKLGLAVSEVEK